MQIRWLAQGFWLRRVGVRRLCTNTRGENGQSVIAVESRQQCYFDESTYGSARSPVVKAGCDPFLAVGGGGEAEACQAIDLPVWDCTDRGPMSELYDFAVHQTANEATVLDPAAPSSVSVGEEVYLVGLPEFWGL